MATVDSELLDPEEPTIKNPSVFRPGRRAGGGNTTAALRAQDLHEAAFGEKTQMDLAKLSIQKQQLLATRSRDLENSLLRRATIARAYKQNSSAAAAIEKLNDLDLSDPEIKKKVSKIITSHPEALGSTAFNKHLDNMRSDWLDYKKAEYSRSTDSLTDPVLSNVYNNVIASHGDPHLAKLATDAVKSQMDSAKKLLASPDLTPEDRASIYDPQTGKFNMDAKTLTNLSIKADQVKASREATTASQESGTKNLSAIHATLKELGAQQEGESKSITGARVHLQELLNDTAYTASTAAKQKANSMSPAAPASNSVTVAVSKYLGKGATPTTGAAPAAAGTAATPPKPLATNQEIDDIVAKYTPTTTAATTPAAPAQPDVVDRSAPAGPAASGPTPEATPDPSATPTPPPTPTPAPTPEQPPVPLTPKPKELTDDQG